jgi:hypothetical protein
MKRAVLLLALSVLIHPTFGQAIVDLSRNVYSFTGEPAGRPDADLDLLEESEINAIANLCIAGATHSQLAQLGFTDLDDRLQQMIRTNLVHEKNGLFLLTFAVFHGKNRDQLQSIVDKRPREVAPDLAKMLDEIYVAVPKNREMAFHLLWSRVMDQMWYEVWKNEKRPGKGPPFTVWAIFPESPYSVGTASYDGVLGGGSNAKTWSHRTICGGFHAGDHQEELLAGGWGARVDPKSVVDLQALGLFDQDGRFTGFAYHAEDEVGRLVSRLKSEYASLVSDAYDYDSLSKQWGVSADVLWVVIQHETAYAILCEFVESGRLLAPGVLEGRGDRKNCKQVISLKLVNPPSIPPEAK